MKKTTPKSSLYSFFNPTNQQTVHISNGPQQNENFILQPNVCTLKKSTTKKTKLKISITSLCPTYEMINQLCTQYTVIYIWYSY